MDSPYLSISYKAKFNPPAPACLISVSSGNKTEQLTALIDSGAEGTFIPWDLVTKLRLIKVGKATIVGATQDKAKASSGGGMYKATIAFLDFTFEHHPVYTSPDYARTYVVIGRDILNNYKTLLNGPDHKFSIG